MKTQFVKAAVAALFGGSMLIAAGAASATTITECQDLITNLQGKTASAEFTGRNATKDESALIAKLGEAAVLDEAVAKIRVLLEPEEAA